MDRLRNTEQRTAEVAVPSAPAVHCAHDEMVQVERVIPNPRNPNKHPEAQVRLLAKIIAAQGWRAPITVSRRSGFIVRGHCRLEAARSLNLDMVPVDYQDYATEAEEYADLVADNRLAELAETDFASLADLLQEIDTGDFDMELAGYDDQELERVMTWTPDNSPEATLPAKWQSRYEVVVECGNEAEQQALFNRLVEEGLKCRVLIL